ncbi:MAG: hypothetical protein OXF56_07905 [Rhodobacteraceae bacterium]|nr:hypothetical protein [Paracoccaceae bacterium]
MTKTRKQLADLASPDEFEVLATAILREAVPAYTSLLHVGTNASGRAVRSPVDGIGIRVHRNSRYLLLVQHTITARNGLRRKWLDPKDGDVTKAKVIFEKEVARGTIRAATLVLASTTDPSEELIRDVHAAAGEKLIVDLWPGSRIADFLDRNPEGQWLREQQFGAEAVRLSVSQARVISEQSLAQYLPLIARDDTVPRTLDKLLAGFARQGTGTGFVIGESGLGKSIALRRLGDEWYNKGGIVLVLAHEVIERAATIENAISQGLCHWAPALDTGCGHEALGLATSEQPILLIVEDVNRSNNPLRIIERLVGWSIASKPDEQGALPARQWRLLCPVWRGNAGLSEAQLRDRVVRNAFMVDRFERSEAAEAVKVRAWGAGVELTALQCDDLAARLGDDPLLIGLNRDWLSPSPSAAMQSYLTANIEEVADQELLASDLQLALDDLAERLVEERTIYPKWRQIRGWLAKDSDTLSAIRRLVNQGRIIHLGSSNADERLAYRHDRVRDVLLIQAITRLIASDRLIPEIWREPFFAALIGSAVSALPISAVNNAAVRNPVALFAALQDVSLEDVRRHELIERAKAWTSSSDFKAEATDRQRHHAMSYLARTDGSFVIDLAESFPSSFPKLEALVRNGDVRAGAVLCATSTPDINHPWRDRIIAHAHARHAYFVPDLVKLIHNGDLSPELLEGALNLAGEIGDPAFCDALAARWKRSDGKTSLSTGWLWAALRCCPPVEHPLVDELCDLWAELPTKVRRSADQPYRNPRWDIAGFSLPSAFMRNPEQSAVAFMIARSKQDRKLKHVLGSILSKIDVPDAVLYSVQLSGKIYRRTEKTGGINLFGNDLKQTWSPKQCGRMLCSESRTAVEQVWRNRRRNRYERKAAFLVWSLTLSHEELAGVAALEADPVLADAALSARLAAGDQSAAPLLKQRIWNTEHGLYWWYKARGVGLACLHEDVQRYFHERRIDRLAEGRVTDADNILAELLMDARDEFAAETIVANWDQLKMSPSFVQAALYLALPETVDLARSAIAECESPETMLEYINFHWGIRNSGRAGVTDLAQLQALEPYYAQMDEMRIISFFEEANRLGELNWRRKHLDPLITKTDRGYCPSDKQALFASLDSEVVKFLKHDRRHYRIDIWFKRREEELWERSTLLALIGEWTHIRADEPAVALLCEGLLHFGERQDLALFDSLAPALRVSCANKIANCVYDVRQRSLSSA